MKDYITAEERIRLEPNRHCFENKMFTDFSKFLIAPYVSEQNKEKISSIIFEEMKKAYKQF